MQSDFIEPLWSIGEYLTVLQVLKINLFVFHIGPMYKTNVMESERIRTTLSITINPRLYQRLKEEIGSRKISGFVERAIAKELGEYDNKLEREQKEFERKLIAGYKRDANRTSDKEDKM